MKSKTWATTIAEKQHTVWEDPNNLQCWVWLLSATLEKGNQMLRAAAFLKGGETGWWTSKFSYMQGEILQGAQPFLGHEPFTCLDVTGTEYIHQKDLGIKYFLGFWPWCFTGAVFQILSVNAISFQSLLPINF